MKTGNIHKSAVAGEGVTVAWTHTTNKPNYDQKTWISTQTISRPRRPLSPRACNYMHKESTGAFFLCILFDQWNLYTADRVVWLAHIKWILTSKQQFAVIKSSIPQCLEGIKFCWCITNALLCQRQDHLKDNFFFSTGNPSISIPNPEMETPLYFGRF